MSAFACPPDCGWCCTHLERKPSREEARATSGFRAMLREFGVYHCRDTPTRGLSLDHAEAQALREAAQARGMPLRLHPRTFLLETRRRLVVVLDWHFPYVECPFYAHHKCTVYEARPLVCRAYPVMAPGPGWKLAPECPRSEPTLQAVASGGLRLGAFLRVENRARRAVEERGAALDEVAWRALDKPGARFAKNLPAAEAAERARRYRPVSVVDFLAEAP